MSNLHDADAIGVLADPLRIKLYRYISREHGPVSREAAAAALDIPVTKAKFHLERLASAGLLTVEFRRLSGKQGPGAGRTSKLYRRATSEFHVALPARRYDVMGEIFATVIEAAQQGDALDEAIKIAAYDRGLALGDEHTSSISDEGTACTLQAASETLTTLGFEAEIEHHAVRLRNCPFDRLAQHHRALVCNANQQFVQGVLDSSGCTSLQARLESCPDYCCVTTSARE